MLRPKTSLGQAANANTIQPWATTVHAPTGVSPVTFTTTNTAAAPTCPAGFVALPSGFIPGVSPNDMVCPSQKPVFSPDGKCFVCTDVPWYENKTILIAGGAGLVVLLLLLRK